MWSPGMLAVSSCSPYPSQIRPRGPAAAPGRAAWAASAAGRQGCPAYAQPYLAHLGGYQPSEAVAEAVIEAEVEARGRRRPRRDQLVCANPSTSSHELRAGCPAGRPSSSAESRAETQPAARAARRSRAAAAPRDASAWRGSSSRGRRPRTSVSRTPAWQRAAPTPGRRTWSRTTACPLFSHCSSRCPPAAKAPAPKTSSSTAQKPVEPAVGRKVALHRFYQRRAVVGGGSQLEAAAYAATVSSRRQAEQAPQHTARPLPLSVWVPSCWVASL